MLKWFRKYNKFILVVGCAVLMVAFLVPQALEQFSPTNIDRTVATVGGESVSAGELQEAEIRLQILQRMGLGALVPYERDPWFLLLRDAEAAGLGASDVEVSQALAAMGVGANGLDPEEHAERFGQQPGVIRAVVADLLVAERYRMLASGHRFDSTGGSLFTSPGLVALGMLNQTRQFLGGEQAQQLGPQFVRQMEFQFLNELNGTGRLSPPFVTSVLFDESERVSGTLAILEPEVTDEVRAGVSEEDLERLFTEYSGFLPGTGAPHPFGYRVPDRVKLEYLTVPASAVRSTVRVGTVDVLDAFRAENPGETPDGDQRDAARERLIDDRTAAKLREIASSLRGELESARRGVPTDAAGRLILGDAFEPAGLDAIADRVEEAHGVRPLITRRTDAFLDLNEAATLEGLAFTGLPDLNLPFSAILNELPAFRPAPTAAANAGDGPEDPLIVEPDPSPVLVQTGVAMPLLARPGDGSLALVRVTDADLAHEPASMDAVREAVTADAALVTAYRSLLDRRAELLTQAVDGGLESLTEAGSVIDVPPFPRRTRRNSADGRPQAPPLPEIGRAAALVDAAFAAVDGLGPAEAASTLPVAQRTVAEGVDARLVLAFFRVDTLERPTKSDLAGDIASGMLTGLDQTLLGEDDEHPLDEASLRERLDFQDEG